MTGEPPFRGSIADVLLAHHLTEARPLDEVRPAVPRELASVVAKMMAKEPARRYQNPGDVVEALGPFFSPSPQARRPEPPRAQPAREWTNSIGMKFVRIAPGWFMMGSPESDSNAGPDEKPQHRVTISKPFYLGTTEVTRGHFRRFVDDTGHRTDAEKDGKGGWGWNADTSKFEQNPRFTWQNAGFDQSDEHPVVNVSWNDAVDFCKWLSRVGGAEFRLPTEAEWEYACRAGTTTLYPFGDVTAALGEYAWYDANSESKTHPVGKKRPNAWGLYDMLGNVWEWCADWYDQEYYASSPATDPPGAPRAPDRVIRGGSWLTAPGRCRPAYRRRFTPGIRDDGLGFRLAAVPVQ